VEALKGHFGALKGPNLGAKMSGRTLIRIRIKLKSRIRIRIRIEVKIRIRIPIRFMQNCSTGVIKKFPYDAIFDKNKKNNGENQYNLMNLCLPFFPYGV
jgi:hypothetical protein